MTQLFVGETLMVNLSPYMATLAFNPPLHKPGEPPLIAVALPLPVAKQLCMILRNQLRQYEERRGAIVIPPESFESMKVSPEDWGDWFEKPSA